MVPFIILFCSQPEANVHEDEVDEDSEFSDQLVI